MGTLYEQLGGEAAVDAAVEVFYGHVMADPRINYWFEGLDMKRQAAKQKMFMKYAFGGPQGYSGKGMRNAHAHLVERGLNDSHFDAVTENLAISLRELEISEDLIERVLAIVETTRRDVLGKEPAAAPA